MARSDQQHSPHIVVIGGAYAGLSAIRSLLQFSKGEITPPMPGPPGQPQATFDISSLIFRPLKIKPTITLIDERDGFYHSVGAPLGQISRRDASDMWVRYDEVSWLKGEESKQNGVNVLHVGVAGLNMQDKKVILSKQTREGDKEAELGYDYLLVATGMRRSNPIIPESLNRDSYLLDVQAFENELNKHDKIVIVGGGAVGIENAAEIKAHFPKTRVILVHSRSQLLSAEPLSEEFKERALQILREEGVEVVLGERVVQEQDIDNGKRLVLSGGKTIECGKVIYSAVQKGANTDFLPNSILDDSGCILTTSALQFPSSVPNCIFHFAAGDVVSGQFIKRSGPAQAMGSAAATNIIASLLAKEDGRNLEAEKLATFQGAGGSKAMATMSLAIASQAVAARPNGMLIWGKEVKQRAFGHGLGIDGTRAKLHLPPREIGKAEVKETEKVSVAASMRLGWT